MKKEGGSEKGGGGVKIHPFHLPWIRASQFNAELPHDIRFAPVPIYSPCRVGTGTLRVTCRAQEHNVPCPDQDSNPDCSNQRRLITVSLHH